jgi:hypothetical protein
MILSFFYKTWGRVETLHGFIKHCHCEAQQRPERKRDEATPSLSNEREEVASQHILAHNTLAMTKLFTPSSFSV